MNKQQIIDYILSIKAEGHGFYLQKDYRQRTLMSSSFAIMTMELIGELSKLDQIRESDYFLDAQQADSGLFIDPAWERSISDIHDPEQNYLHYQTTAFALSTLNAMGLEPQHKLRFLEPFRGASYLAAWLASLEWANPWHISNKIMFILQFLSYEDIMHSNQTSREAVLFILKTLQKYQDSQTGLWGTNRGASTFNGMAGTFHFLSFYQYYGVAIDHTSKMHNATLSLQAGDGLFHPFGGGGGCEDLDALYILNTIEPAKHTSENFKKQMAKSYQGLLNARNTDGGFCWSKRPLWDLSVSVPFLNPFSAIFHIDMAKWIIKRKFLSLLVPSLRDPISYRYSNWDQMKYDVDASDTWSTWVRLLSLASIERSFPEFKEHDIQFHHRSLPALGWLLP